MAQTRARSSQWTPGTGLTRLKQAAGGETRFQPVSVAFPPAARLRQRGPCGKNRPPAGALLGRFYLSRACCRSSVVEHSIGNGEVDSSILSGSTIPYRRRPWPHASVETEPDKLPRPFGRGRRLL